MYRHISTTSRNIRLY